MRYGMTEPEYSRYKSWRDDHKCVSQVEITIVPDCVQDLINVRCFLCGEILRITDFDEG